MNQSDPEQIELTAADGQRLAASWFPPTDTATDLACIIGPAMAVSRRFYDEFAGFLASEGIGTLGFDFRGFGDSAKEPLVFNEGFRSFGLDLSAAIAEIAKRASRIVYVGHSLGGQALGFSPDNSKIARAISIASGTGYYGWSPFPESTLRYVFWTALLPPVTRIAGYYPGRKLGLLGDIPKPIALTWAAMCRQPGYFKQSLSDPPPKAFGRFNAPLLSISFSDDPIMPKSAVDELNRNFLNADVTRAHLWPKDIDLESVGHFDAFKHGRTKLWPAMSAWLKGESWNLNERIIAVQSPPHAD